VSLTKTSKHGKDWKKEMYKKVREAGEGYNSIFVLRMDGLRIGALSAVRKHFRGSEMFLGKNKVMALALGKDEASEVNENVHKISERLKGQCGLLFTDQSEDEVVAYFDSFMEKDYARSGAKAKETVVLEEGPLTQLLTILNPI
jgi:mRNA turnover protein 4